MSKPTMGSLFAGIGGFDLGFERAGFETKWQVEIDPFCRKVLAKHFPNAERYEDVREVGEHNLSKVDVICGGFPCQDISNIGTRSGIEGEQSGLWRDHFRIIRDLLPRFALVENVAALTGFGMESILCDFASIGYDAQWEVIPASWVGAPHIRERVWIIAYSKKEPWVYESFSIMPQIRLLNEYSHWWSAHPWDEANAKVCHMDDGIPSRVAITQSLGNSVVPQIPEMYANRIMQALSEVKHDAS